MRTEPGEAPRRRSRPLFPGQGRLSRLREALVRPGRGAHGHLAYGVDDELVTPGGAVRRLRARAKRARGIALSTVARILGHADPRMTLRYAHVSDRDVQAAAERIGKTIEAAMETGKSTKAISSCGAAINLRPRDHPERTSQPTGENRDWGSEVMSKEHVDWPQGDAGSAEKRKPRSIRFHDTEWDRNDAFAEQRAWRPPSSSVSPRSRSSRTGPNGAIPWMTSRPPSCTRACLSPPLLRNPDDESPRTPVRAGALAAQHLSQRLRREASD